MRYLVHYEICIEVEADSFRAARDRAIGIFHGEIPEDELNPEEGIDTELVLIEDELGNEEPTNAD